MPRLRLQGRRASPFRFAFIMISLPGSASKTSITCPPASGGVATGAREKLGFEGIFVRRERQKQRLFCRVVDLGRKREGAAIDFFRTQEANVL